MSLINILHPDLITPDNIKQLPPNQVFVFGSNLRGVHGNGAALIAWQKFGAVPGCGFGHFGHSYAIPTKDMHIETIPLHVISIYVEIFKDYARKHPELQFMVTAIGCGLAGYKPEDIAPMFKGSPGNVALPLSFWEVLL